MKFLDELKKLNLDKDKFAIGGSGPMGIRGLRECNDLDLIVKKDLFEELKKKYPLRQGRDDCIEIGNIELFDNWKPWFEDSDKMIDEADVIDGIRLLKLETVLEWKKLRGKEKDIADIKVIEEYLARK